MTLSIILTHGRAVLFWGMRRTGMGIFYCCFPLILLYGCTESNGSHDVNDSDNIEDVQNIDCAPASVVVVEDITWPAGGHELIVRAEDQQGLPWQGDAGCLFLNIDSFDEEGRVEIAPRVMPPGITLLSVQPGAPDTYPHYRDAIRAFIETRPETERIAIFGWGEALIQISDFTTNRDRLFGQIDRLERISRSNTFLDAQNALQQALEIVESVESPNMRGLRGLVMIGDASVLGVTLEAPPAATVQWVLPPEATNGFTQGSAVAFADAAALNGALLKVSERLDKHAASAFHRIGVCSDPLTDTAAKLPTSSGETLDITLSESLEGEKGGVCDPAEIIASTREGIHTVDLILNDEELAEYQVRLDAILALVEEYDLPALAGQLRLLVEGYGTTKDPFNLHVSLNQSQEPIKAMAHLRGQNALFCDRKSFTVNLDGKDARFFGDESGSDEFYLMAMCQDPGLFFGFLGDTFYGRYDLFPPRVRYVEVRFNGKTQGVYLMMEKREEEIQRDSARLRGVIRRRYELWVAPEIEYTASDNETLLAAYNALSAAEIEAVALPDYLRERMDLDQYLRWIALNSLLQNADTMDECLFISTETVDPAGRPTDHFRLMAWDPEDIQGVCRAINTFSDGYGLTYCQKAAFEHLILANPVIFGDYVEILKSLLEDLTPEDYQDVLDEARDQLFVLLDREGVAQALNLEGFPDAASAKEMITNRMVESKEKLEARRAELLDAIQKYETSNPTQIQGTL